LKEVIWQWQHDLCEEQDPGHESKALGLVEVDTTKRFF